ncbi:hypothetical protein D3C81_1585500 [compost metagenome]
MPFGVWFLLHRPTRLADGFGHAQLPYSLTLPPLPSRLREVLRNSPQKIRFPRFHYEIRPSFFSIVFIHFFVKWIISLISFRYKALFS